MKEARSLADRLQGGNKYTKADRDKQAQMIRTEGGGSQMLWMSRSPQNRCTHPDNVQKPLPAKKESEQG